MQHLVTVLPFNVHDLALIRRLHIKPSSLLVFHKSTREDTRAQSRNFSRTLRGISVAVAASFLGKRIFPEYDCVTIPGSTFRRRDVSCHGFISSYVLLRPSILPGKELSTHFQNRLHAPRGRCTCTPESGAAYALPAGAVRLLYSSSNIFHKGHSCMNPIPNINRRSRDRAGERNRVYL